MTTLNTEMARDGATIVTRQDGTQVAVIRIAHLTAHGRYWVNMEDGYPFSAMPMHSLEAAQYLVLASVIEHDAQAARKAVEAED